MSSLFSFRFRPAIGALTIIALAFFLRVYRLADKNVWWDEGWTVWLSQHDLAWIALRTASDEHPPLHYWLMHAWQALLGPDAFTGRFFSLFFGILTVALVYRLGKAMGGARLGLIAALLLALARFQVWWSQDIKNYTLSMFFAWASVWFAWRMINGGRSMADRTWRAVMGYVITLALALYSHYLAALIFLASNLFVAIVLLARWRSGVPVRALFIRWSVAQLGVLVLFAPWLALYLQYGATWSAAPAFDFGLFLRLAATVMALGVTTYIENYALVVAGLLLVAALGAGWLFGAQAAEDRRASYRTKSLRLAALDMLLVVVVPPLLLYVLSLTPAAIFAPKVQARYLLILLPAFSMLLGLGVLFIARWSRGLAALALGCIVAAELFTLAAYYQERRLRDDYQTLTQMLNNFGQAGDVIVLHTDQEYPTFLYYLKQPLDWIGVPNGAPVTAETAQRIAAKVRAHGAAWLVTIPDALAKDPAHLIEQSLAEELPKQYEQTFGDKRLTLYAETMRNVNDVPPANFVPQARRNDVFDERLTLVGLDLPVREAFAGDIVRVVTYWQSQDLTTINLALETLNGERVAQASIPISIGAHERAQADLQVPPGMLPGELRVAAQARLRALELGRLSVLPRTSGAGSGVPAETREERFGDHIRLVGITLPRRELRAGEQLPLTLFWQTDAPLSVSYTVFVHLLGAEYNPAQNNFLWGQVDSLPVQAGFPTTAWAPGQLIADEYSVPIDANAPRGAYKIEVGLYDAATGERLRVSDPSGKELGDAVIVGEVEVR